MDNNVTIAHYVINACIKFHQFPLISDLVIKFLPLQDGHCRHIGFIFLLPVSAFCNVWQYWMHLRANFEFYPIISNETAAILDYRQHVRFHVILILHKISARVFLISFSSQSVNICQSYRVFKNPRWPPPPSWISVSTSGFGFCILRQYYMHLCAKFGENWIISNVMAAKSVKTRWRLRPPWILFLLPVLISLCVSWWIAYILKIWCWSVHWFNFSDTFRSQPLIMENPYSRPKFGGFGAKDLQNFRKFKF